MPFAREEAKELLDSATASKNAIEAVLNASGQNFDAKIIANEIEAAADGVGAAIEKAIKAITGNPKVPKHAMGSSLLNVATNAAAAAINIVGMMTMPRDVLANTDSAEEMTRDQMLFGALLAVASETQTREGQRAMVKMAAEFVMGNKENIPQVIAHRQFEQIRGYKYESCKTVEA